MCQSNLIVEIKILHRLMKEKYLRVPKSKTRFLAAAEAVEEILVPLKVILER